MTLLPPSKSEYGVFVLESSAPTPLLVKIFAPGLLWSILFSVVLVKVVYVLVRDQDDVYAAQVVREREVGSARVDKDSQPSLLDQQAAVG